MSKHHIRWVISSILCVGLLLAGCNFGIQGDVTPTVEPIVSETPSDISQNPTMTPTLPACPTPTIPDNAPNVVQIASPVPTNTPGLPTETSTPTPTLGPYEHTIREGEVLGSIVAQYGYFDPSIYAEVVRINPGIPNADTLPGPGTVILIPRQTATPIPIGIEETERAAATRGLETFGGVTLPENTVIDCHIVQEGETILGIAQQHNTTLEILSRLNPQILFSRCNFDLLTGGEECTVSIFPGDCVNVPFPTPTPTLTPTPSGNETPTPTPTYAAPRVIFPPDGAVAQAGVFSLQWVSTGILHPDEAYLITIIDTTANTQPVYFTTRETAFELPSALIPTDGQPHVFTWSVNVAVRNENGVYRPISNATVRTFQWQSR